MSEEKQNNQTGNNIENNNKFPAGQGNPQEKQGTDQPQSTPQGPSTVKPENQKTSAENEKSTDEANSEKVTSLDDAKKAAREAARDSAMEDHIEAGNIEPDNGTPQLTPVERLEAEVAELKDKLLRQAADMENLRRRTEREKQDISKYAISNFAKDIITLDDNLTRTLSAVPEGAIDEDPALKALVEGVEMTGRELTNVLDRHGISRIDPKGDIFDPNNHQALFEIPNPEVLAGTILEVVAPGFMIDSRVLRPAMVGVAKGGEKPTKEQKQNDQAAKNAETSTNKEDNSKKEDKSEENIDKSV